MANLIVPLAVDALFLKSDQHGTLGPFADFSGLPWSVPGDENHTGHDENADTAFTSQNVLVRPLSDETSALEKGVHLHWALPQPLTVGRHPIKKDGTPDQTSNVFPHVPNRWLITRETASGARKSWIVESDYLWPEGTEWSPGRVTYPVASRGDDGFLEAGKPTDVVG